MTGFEYRILITKFLFLTSLATFADVSMKNSVKSLDDVVKTITEVTGPQDIKCQSPWRPYVIENPFLDDVYAIEGKREDRKVSGKELIEHLKNRFNRANYQGTMDGYRCSVEFEEKDGSIIINMKEGYASIQKFPVHKDILAAATPSTSEQIYISPEKEYIITSSKSKKVLDMDDFEKNYENHSVDIERIQTSRGSHLFFSMSSPNMPGHHVFQYDFFNCYFKAALY